MTSPMLVKTCTFALLLTPLLSLASLAQSAPPLGDTYSYSAKPKSNYGSQPSLLVQSGSNGYLQFDLATLPAGVSVGKATLRLFVNTVTTGGSFDVYQVDGPWSESALTYNNEPSLGASATGLHPVAVTTATQNQFVVMDITALVQDWVSGLVPNNGVALVMESSTGSFAFDSKESITTSHQPELEIAMTGPAGPQGPQGPQGLTGSAGPQGPAGQTGPQGAAGATGPQGPIGPTGAIGTQGPSGPQGAAGATGSQGPIGPMGPMGPLGATGPQGPAGTNGTNGLGFNFRNAFDPSASYAVNDVTTYNGSTYVAMTTNQGPNNPTPDMNPTAWTLMALAGAAGPAGAPGPQGTIGLTGPAGATGPTGAQGPAGAIGPQGPGGMTGATGQQGPIGQIGPQGPAGTNGTNGAGFNFRNAFDPSASYAVDDVTSYNGSTYVAIAANQGPNNTTPDMNLSSWSLMAQAGAAGQAGAPGSAGPQGSQGPIGLTGPVGPAGPSGAPGVIQTIIPQPGITGGGSATSVSVGLDTNFTDQRYSSAYRINGVGTGTTLSNNATYATLATLTLPAGSYLLSGKVSAANNLTTNNPLFQCVLWNGTSTASDSVVPLDGSIFYIAGGNPGWEITLPLQSDVSLPSGGSITLQCQVDVLSGGVTPSVNVFYWQLHAVPLIQLH